MITKIFYSLVLYPHIFYDEDILWWKIFDILEFEYWTIKIELSNWEKIFFKHKNFVEKFENLDLKNWQIISDNKNLKNYFVEKLKWIDENRDFNFFDDKLLNRKRPFWVVLTITSKCNIFCYYCFNDIDYDLKYRNTRENYPFEYWKKIVDDLYEAWTRVVILTWWEPMVAPFFWELLDYLKEKNIFIHINTNWTVLSDGNLKKLNDNYSVNLMVSMHEFNDNDYYEVNKKWLKMTFEKDKVPQIFYKLFTNKVNQLRKINNLKNISLEFLTILNWKNILNLDKIYNFWEKCNIKIHNWQFFRLYWTKNNKWASKIMMDLAVRNLYKNNKKYWKDYKIVDPVPFCVTKDLEMASKVIDGVLSDTHDVKTIITTQGFVQLMSAYDNNFWNIWETPMQKIFESDFVYKQLNNWFLPKQCENCKYKEECRWWSRMDANLSFWDYGLPDPIADFNNKIIV